jgi:ubiquinone/menaquinone biosynthesis C-methylase UbiE
LTSRDIFQALDTQEAATLDMVIARMEARAKEPRYAEMRRAYLDRLDLANARTFLDLGCGTGIDARVAAARPEFRGVASGIDASEGMISAGLRFAADEGVADRVFLRPGEAAATGLPSGAFDVVVMSTLVSHVEDPAAVLREGARLLSMNGRLMVFDADFASIAFGHPDATVARSMQDLLLESFVANPRVMRDMPTLLPSLGLEVASTQSHVICDAGTTQFFGTFVNGYAPLIPNFQPDAEAMVRAWIEYENGAIEGGYFFGSLNFHAYLLRKPR